MLDDFLEHHGVKGMKWGVRKDRRSGGQKSSRQTAKTLTDKELKKRVNRLNMEKQYVSLAKKDAEASKSRGKKIVDAMLDDFGSRVIKNLTIKAADSFSEYLWNKAQSRSAGSS